MTDDEIKKFLRPRFPWGAIGGAIGAAAAVWAATEFLHSRASSDETKALQTDVFKVRLDQETIKGDVKAISIRVEEGFKQMNQKLDASDTKRRR